MEKPGLTKREYFAALVLQGLAANNKLNNQTFDESAFMAVKMADELIDALRHKPNLIGETLSCMSKAKKPQ